MIEFAQKHGVPVIYAAKSNRGKSSDAENLSHDDLKRKHRATRQTSSATRESKPAKRRDIFAERFQREILCKFEV